MPFTIVRQDITKMDVDAIVNAANTELKMGGGVCGAIFSAAGASELQAACDELAPIRTGEAVITPGFRLPAKYVIHTAGPIYRDGRSGEESLLRSAYLNSLELAAEKGCESIAFPLISSGIYGYPKEEALRVATEAIRSFLETRDMDVFLAVFDRAAFVVSEKLLGEVQSYIDEKYAEERLEKERGRDRLSELRPFHKTEFVSESRPMAKEEILDARYLDKAIDSLEDPFSVKLFKLIDARGKSDAEVYKKANLDRRHFSKIRTGKGYTPGKPTIIALSIALELSLEETADLLRRAGYALSRSSKFDVIAEYFIVNGRYDIFEINEVLFKFGQQLLGA
ncbi:MAG: macro domain-containing protein [Aminivibrio sp.]|jgi:O-acetyl-ADP-ribose deacetylase (regulator of RNase III)